MKLREKAGGGVLHLGEEGAKLLELLLQRRRLDNCLGHGIPAGTTIVRIMPQAIVASSLFKQSRAGDFTALHGQCLEIQSVTGKRSTIICKHAADGDELS